MPSELRVDKVSSTTSPYDPVFSTTGGALSHRNMVINGDMQVWQRGTSSTALSNSNTYVPDRFNCRAGVGSGHTAIRSTDVPTTGGASFSNSLKFTVGTGATLSANSGNNYFYYAMEGYDSNPTKIGTAYAKIMTISFWVKASVTGVYGFAVTNDANARTYAGSYTVGSANTWEKHTITIPASGAGGTWDTTNGRAITLLWNWGAGSDFKASSAGWATADDRAGVDAGSSIHLVDGTHNGATWYITGVQLELGSVATPFEHKSFGEELTRCQRYYQKYENNSSAAALGTFKHAIGDGVWYQSYQILGHMPYAQKRAVPAISVADANTIVAYANAAASTSATTTCFDLITNSSARINVAAWDNNRTIGYGTHVIISSTKYIEINAEI